ncbi:MAG: CHAT domain-containing protein [Xenococcaceae cyanobacterium]
MEKLKLTLSPIDGIKFKIFADKYGEETSQLPFSNGKEDPHLFTVLNSLNSFDLESKYESNEEDDISWMLDVGILSKDDQDKCFFHKRMRENIGGILYKALFPGKIGWALDQKLGEAGSLGQYLHIQLQYDADVIQKSRLSLYPWQLVYREHEFLAKRRVIFSHLIAHVNSLPTGKRKVKHIKVLLISSTASNEEEQKLNNKESTILNGLKKAEEKGHACLLNWYDELNQKPTKECLWTYCIYNSENKDKLPDIIHFDGHGTFKKECTSFEEILSKPQGFLVFENDEGKPDYINAEQFANILNSLKDSKPALVIITACRSALAYQSQSVFNGIAQSVLREVPAVVATAFDISEKSAPSFIETFYRVLGTGQSLLEAVKSASANMHKDFYDYEWYRPVIFLRCKGDEDGYLFEFEKQSVYREHRLANRTDEVDCFANILKKQELANKGQILLIQAPDKYGKSTLLKRFDEECSIKGIKRIFFDIDQQEGGIVNFLTNTYNTLQNYLLKKFNQCLEKFSDNPPGLPAYTIGEKIRYVLDGNEQQLRQAFLEDLKEICKKRKIVFLFDSFKNIGSELEEWIEVLLEQTQGIHQLVVVVAGEQVFQLKEKLSSCEQLELKLIRNENAWYQFAQEVDSPLNKNAIKKLMDNHQEGTPLDINTKLMEFSLYWEENILTDNNRRWK